MTKRSLGTIGLLNFGPIGTFQRLLGLRAARVVPCSSEADTVPPGAAAPAEEAPTAGAISEAARPQVASRAMNFERTSTTPSGCPMAPGSVIPPGPRRHVTRARADVGHDISDQAGRRFEQLVGGDGPRLATGTLRCPGSRLSHPE